MVEQIRISVGWQMVFSIIPFVWVWAAYRIEKLRKALVIFVLSAIAIGFFIPFPFSIPLVLGIHIYFMRRWSIGWNEQLNKGINLKEY